MLRFQLGQDMGGQSGANSQIGGRMGAVEDRHCFVHGKRNRV